MAWARLICLLALLGATLRAAPGNDLAAAGAHYVDRATADAALARTFTLQGVTAVQPLRADGAGYDWDWRGPRDDPEWAWFFNRHHWFPALLAAYQETGDTRYSAALAADLDDWMATHPPPGRITFSAAWRPLEAARRLVHSWLPVAPALAALPGARPGIAARFDASLVAHGEHLLAHHAFGGNHLITEMLALTRLSLARPDLPGAGRWLDYGLDQLSRAYDEQVYPDGAHVELSTHYQRVIALNYQALLVQLRAAGRDDLVAKWEPRVERLWRYVAAVMTPSGANPQNNDSDRENYRGLLLSHSPGLLAPDRAPGIVHLPWAGQTVWRGGPPERPHWAFFEAGPRGTDHDHADHLQFNLSLGTADFLVDAGRYTYAPGPWRDYFAGPAGHNVLLLDGRGADPRPRRVGAEPAPARFGEKGPLSWAWGDATFSDSDGRRIGDWRRVVIYARDAGWVVVDRIVTFSARELTTQWHWAPSVEATPAGARWTARSGEAELEVNAPNEGRWQAQRGQETPSPRGWFSPVFNKREPATQTDLMQNLRGPRVNVWLFRPPSTGESLMAETVAAGRVVVRCAGRRWTLDLETMSCGPAN